MCSSCAMIVVPGRNEAGRQALRNKMVEYMDRAEWIKAHIDSEKTSSWQLLEASNDANI